jgi:CelD/BcsL family acetyltransferase involved in cellulose biosynthesis
MTLWSIPRWGLQRAAQHLGPDPVYPLASAWRPDRNGAVALTFDGHALESQLPTTGMHVPTATMHMPATMTHLRVEKVESLEELRSLAAAWRALEETSRNALPFWTFEWVESWWLHFAERNALVEDSLAVRVVRDQDGALVAAVPLILTRRPARTLRGVRILHSLSADPNITEIAGAIVDPAHEGAAVRALMAHFQADAATYDWLEWSGVRRGSASERVLEATGLLRWTRDNPNYVLPLAPSWDEFHHGLKRNVRESVRKCYNSLKRDGHAVRLDVVDQPDGVCAGLEHFFRLHKMRAGVAGTVPHSDFFASAIARAFLCDVSERLAHRGVTRIFLLSIDGQVVACRIGFVLGDCLYLYYSGYDPAWGRYSVMTTLVAEVLKHAMEHGLKTANLSTGADVSKTRWGPEERVYREAIQIAPSMRSRLAYRIYQPLVVVRETVRRRAGPARILGLRRMR